MTRILAIDAATEGCSVALYTDGTVEAVRSVLKKQELAWKMWMLLPAAVVRDHLPG